MARTLSPAESSPLSSRRSSQFDDSDDDMEDDTIDVVEMPPSKRMRLGNADSSIASAARLRDQAHTSMDDEDDEGHDHDTRGELDEGDDISSDSSGDIPVTPTVTYPGARPEEDDTQEQVTVCAWDACDAGDLHNMDRLVEHIHKEHIEGRQKKYTCEWLGCVRQSLTHASGYALKAHMRSHTREKPFYCYLPECDRSFTRSDALAKHMRTVHETEALRPSDPVPKSMQAGANPGSNKPGSKLKIVLKTPSSHAAGDSEAMDEDHSGDDSITQNFTELTSKDGFSTVEREIISLPKLHMLCKRRLAWALEDSADLKEDCEAWTRLYKAAWLEKEVLLDQVVAMETSRAAGLDSISREEGKVSRDGEMEEKMDVEMVTKSSPVDDDNVTAD